MEATVLQRAKPTHKYKDLRIYIGIKNDILTEVFMDKKRSHLRISEKKDRGIIPAMFFGFVFTAIFSLIFLLLASLFFYNSEDPSSLLMPLAYASLAASSLIFGFSTAKISGT